MLNTHSHISTDFGSPDSSVVYKLIIIAIDNSLMFFFQMDAKFYVSFVSTDSLFTREEESIKGIFFKPTSIILHYWCMKNQSEQVLTKIKKLINELYVIRFSTQKKITQISGHQIISGTNLYLKKKINFMD